MRFFKRLLKWYFMIYKQKISGISYTIFASSPIECYAGISRDRSLFRCSVLYSPASWSSSSSSLFPSRWMTAEQDSHGLWSWHKPAVIESNLSLHPSLYFVTDSKKPCTTNPNKTKQDSISIHLLKNSKTVLYNIIIHKILHNMMHNKVIQDDQLIETTKWISCDNVFSSPVLL